MSLATPLGNWPWESQCGISLYSGGSLTSIPQLAGNATTNLSGMSQNGLIAGYFNSGTAFAYDVATSKYYTFGSAGSWAQAVNGTYVVGSDGANSTASFGTRRIQLYTQIPGLAAAQGISDNGQLVAGLTQGSTPNAAVYSLSGHVRPPGHLLEGRGHRCQQQRPGDRRQLERLLQRRIGPLDQSRNGLFPRLERPPRGRPEHLRAGRRNVRRRASRQRCRADPRLVEWLVENPTDRKLHLVPLDARHCPATPTSTARWTSTT